MKKKTVKPDRICFECLHYEACQSWNIGSLVKTAADNCVNYRASVNRGKNEATDAIEDMESACNRCEKDYEFICEGGMSVKSLPEIENNYTYHAPKEGQPERYERIRYKAKMLAAYINENCPDSREKSLAFTRLEEAVMWANASIARNE